MVDNMEWFNVFGLIFIAVIMIPNVVFAIKCKDGFDNKWNNKYVEVTEQVGRLGCFGFMIINIPGTWFGWWSDEAFALYLIVDTILVMLYCAIWIICFKKNSVFRALALSIIPSMLFLFSGIMSRSVLPILFLQHPKAEEAAPRRRTVHLQPLSSDLERRLLLCTGLFGQASSHRKLPCGPYQCPS